MLLAESQWTAPAPEMPDTKPIVERMLMRIRSTDEFPTISKHLIEINQKISGNTDASNASELASIILQDYALTNQLLKLVNSAYYGFAAGKVSTVTRAVVVLGYENVRLATLRLTLFDHFMKGNKSEAGELKEAIVTSFWAGVLARDIARQDKHVDPEEAFVCAMLGQLGKLLMIYYLPGDYKKVRDYMAARDQRETMAVKAVCGITYEELGMAVAKHWNFPSQICESMPLLPKKALEDKTKPPARLWTLASLVKEICAVVQENGAASNLAAVERVVERYQGHVKFDKRKLKTIIKDSLDQMEEQASALDLNYGHSHFLDHLMSAIQPKGQAGMPSGAGAKATDAPALDPVLQSYSPTGGTAFEPGHDASSAKEIIMEGIQEISQAMMDTYEINDVVSMSLEILFRSLGFQRALMFIHDNRRRMMAVRFGYGKDSQKLCGQLEFLVNAKKDLFGLSIQVGKDLLVADTDDARLSHLMPQWYRQDLNAPAFIFLPVVFQKVCIGAFYADRDAHGAPITEAEHRLISMLRNQLLLAIKFRH